ncbi:MAG: hypothetical protein EOO14_03835 [Chitinophagaceae bacterium]|nr:MAG: hypothetical protein EOO14_03835 [Chitinophagaceae bacterium]
MKKTVFLALFAICLGTVEAAAQTSTPSGSGPVFEISDSATYVGKYKYEGLPFDYMTVSVKEGKLYYFGGEYSGFLTPVKDKKDVFDANGEALFTFHRNSENKVADLQIDYQGQSFMGKRESK